MGRSMLPKRMEVEKHSRITERSVEDFKYEYQRQASPALQVFCCLKSVELNDPHSGASVEKRLPQAKHFTLSFLGSGLLVSTNGVLVVVVVPLVDVVGVLIGQRCVLQLRDSNGGPSHRRPPLRAI